jgi:hypothetical protein
MHYCRQIEDFGEPAGVCSSITKSHHITAMKKPWRRSNHNSPMGQILLTNLQLEKLNAMCIDFAVCGMIPAGHDMCQSGLEVLGPHQENDDDNGGGGGDGPSKEEDVLGHVKLAQRHGESSVQNYQ